MTIKKNIGTFRDGSAESMRRSVSTRKFADSVSSTVSTMDKKIDTTLETAQAYTPSAPADWAAPAPTSVANAIDRLAARLKTVGGAVIP